MVLIAVYLYEIKTFFVRCPTDIGEITIGGITCIQVNAFIGRRVINTDLYLVAGHSGHRITYVIYFSYTCCDVYKRILSHHTFVHTVESEQIAFRTPEGSFVDTEFVAVHRLSANDTFGFVGDLSSVDIQIVFYGIGEILIDSIIIVGRWFFGQVISADNFSLLPIVNSIADVFR